MTAGRGINWEILEPLVSVTGRRSGITNRAGALGRVIVFDTEKEAVAATNVGDGLSRWLHVTGHANPMSVVVLKNHPRGRRCTEEATAMLFLLTAFRDRVPVGRGLGGRWHGLGRHGGVCIDLTALSRWQGQSLPGHAGPDGHMG